LQAERIISHIDLSSGNCLTVYDLTKAYFGDYHHVKLEIRGVLSTRDSLKSAPYLRTLEKMAVPSAEINSAIQLLLAEFKKTSLVYLDSPDFVQKLVAASLTRKSPVVKRYSEPSLRV
jgi:hypothetical protein